MTVLKVEGMHCNMCVARIDKALTAAGLTFKVCLDDKTVTVEGGDEAVKTAIDELDDLGFEAVKA